jgi:hypothetical protein
MKSVNLYSRVLLLTGILGLGNAPLWAAEGVTGKVAAGMSNYCHMKFPAIREETLSWDRPVLKDASSGDIIDFYGPCNYDPLGKDAIWSQRLELKRRWS